MGVTKRSSDLLSDDRDGREKPGDIALNLAAALMSHMALTSEAPWCSGAKEGGEWQTRAVRLTAVPHGRSSKRRLVRVRPRASETHSAGRAISSQFYGDSN